MTNEEMLQAIADNFLCVRRLPFETTTTYFVESNQEVREGFEESFWKPNDEYFQKAHSKNWFNWKNFFYEKFPNGRRQITQTETVNNGGWWYVKPITNTSSTVSFNREYDKFFASTLEEAVQLFLDSKL